MSGDELTPRPAKCRCPPPTSLHDHLLLTTDDEVELDILRRHAERAEDLGYPIVPHSGPPMSDDEYEWAGRVAFVDFCGTVYADALINDALPFLETHRGQFVKYVWGLCLLKLSGCLIRDIIADYIMDDRVDYLRKVFVFNVGYRDLGWESLTLTSMLYSGMLC
uniref:Uncharacterized protein n=1 Tax=Eutreptiella gymnastica TaxID=73025 RepID=A0A7S1NLG7_9EUGL|mmetsp:Transcript_571/g.1160  ORF Transcript_571/g.1160 Transcript_571/m.1160 type:complete len:164 (+) Transcript_571:94-585(+)